nr:protein GVQW3-like [Megalopta genalis]
MVDFKFQVRTVVEFLRKFEWKSADIVQNLEKVYGTNAQIYGKPAVYEWMKRFKEDRESLEDDDRSGKPAISVTDENVLAEQEIVKQDGRVLLHEIAARVHISYGSVQTTVVTGSLRLSKLSARWVPKALHAEHVTARIDNALNFLNRFDVDSEDFPSRLVSGDETSVYQYYPESKIQSKQWSLRSSRGPIKFRTEKSVKKILTPVFFGP